jgi:hypothetical protein
MAELVQCQNQWCIFPTLVIGLRLKYGLAQNRGLWCVVVESTVKNDNEAYEIFIQRYN